MRHFVIGIVVLFVLVGLWKASLLYRFHPKGEASNMLRVAYHINHSVNSYDPARIDTTPQANIILSLYGRLIDFASDGQIVPGVCKEFLWDKDEIHFAMRRDHSTFDGWAITAEDAAISLKRLILKATNTHGDLASFLCPGHSLKSIYDECPGIRVDGNTLILKPSKAYLGKFLIPLLASPDFSIIPKKAIHLDSPKLEIIDYRNTSGAYYVDQDDSTGALLLKANPTYHEYSKEIPQAIQLVPVSGDQSIEQYRQDKVDLITTSDNAPPAESLNLKNEVADTAVHTTLDIKTWIFFFTRKGQNHISREERISIGNELRKAYFRTLNSEKIKPTIEYFPNFGEGSLDREQLDQLKKIFQNIPAAISNKKVVLGVFNSQVEKLKKLLPELSFLEIKGFSVPPWGLPDEEQPDLCFGNIDGAFFEDISMISYNADLGTFGMTRQEGVEWLNEYMKTEDKAERLKRLRALHFKFLSEATVIPLGNAPYVAVARAPWKIHFSQFFAGSPLWQIRKD